MEVEAKFTLDAAAVSALQSIKDVGGYTLGPARTKSDEDRYLDTANLLILKGGYACRVRQRDGQPILTVKSLTKVKDELHTREEYETPLASDSWQPKAWAKGPARDLVRRLVDDAPLVLLFTLRQQREVRPVYQGERLVGEWSLDRVTVEADGRAEHGIELEIELKGQGREDDLRALATALAQTPGVTPNPRSKFEWGASLLGLDQAVTEPEAVVEKGGAKGSPGVRPDDTLAEAGRKILRLNYKRMRKEEAGARAGEDIEAVHDMRVATRRMRAALSLFGPYYRPKLVRDIERGLKRTARTLGGVRDLDVFLDRANDYRAEAPEGRREGLDPMFTHWHKKRDAARAALTDWLDSSDYKKFEDRFEEFLDAPAQDVASDHGEGVHPSLVRHLAPGIVWAAYAHVRAYDTALPDCPIETLHALRIEGKRLRYTLEFFAEDLGPQTPSLIRAVTRMQDHLGNLQDADVDVHALTDYLARYDGKPHELPAVRAYLNTRLATRARLRARFGPIWATISGPKFRRALAAAVATL